MIGVEGGCGGEGMGMDGWRRRVRGDRHETTRDSDLGVQVPSDKDGMMMSRTKGGRGIKAGAGRTAKKGGKAVLGCFRRMGTSVLTVYSPPGDCGWCLIDSTNCMGTKREGRVEAKEQGAKMGFGG